MKRVSVFIVVVTLILGVVSCEGEGEPMYEVVMAVNPVGGGTAIDLTDASPYPGGTVVSIKAEAAVGYEFSHWSAASAGGDDMSLILQSGLSLESSIELPLDGVAQTVIVTANFVVVYNLTIASTDGGDVTIPGEGNFIYEIGTVVNLVAEAEEGYRFVEWTGYVGTIGNISADVTTIAMNGHYSITANFALEIWDWYDLDTIRDNLGGNYILMNDLEPTMLGYEDLASPIAHEGKGWEPIGTLDEPFTGTFDGQGYSISGLYVNRASNHGGLFGYVRGATLENVYMYSFDITCYNYVGALAGTLADAGTVNDCYAAGTVSGHQYIGGLVGENYGTIVSCQVINSHVESLTSYAGGMTGYIGGSGSVSNCRAAGNVTGITCIGGLVGFQDISSTVQRSCVTNTEVYGSERLGGLVGYSYGGDLNNCYAKGSVTGNYAVGGLAGFVSHVTVRACFANVYIDGEISTGGLVGLSEESTVTDSFWDTETSGLNSSAGGTGKTTAEMQNIATFSGAGWNITAVAPGSTNTTYIWNIVNNVTYPFLSWQAVS